VTAANESAAAKAILRSMRYLFVVESPRAMARQLCASKALPRTCLLVRMTLEAV
jgi:hypothetical protein